MYVEKSKSILKKLKGDHFQEQKLAKLFLKLHKETKQKDTGVCVSILYFPPGGTEVSKSIHNDHLIKAKKTAHRQEEPEGWRREKAACLRKTSNV